MVRAAVGSISFVQDVLFPYARERMDRFVRDRQDDPKMRETMLTLSKIQELRVGNGADGQLTQFLQLNQQRLQRTKRPGIEIHKEMAQAE